MSAQTVVVDTSIVVKWLRGDEPGSDEAYEWWQRYLEGEVQIAEPSLLSYELANALVYKRDMSVVAIREALDIIYESGIDWFEPNQPLIERAVQIARTFDVTVYDATFVALAEALGADLVTADERAAVRLTTLPFVKLLGS